MKQYARNMLIYNRLSDSIFSNIPTQFTRNRYAFILF